MHETSLIIQFVSRKLSGVSFQIVLFISNPIKLIAQIFEYEMNESIHVSGQWPVARSVSRVRSRVRVRMWDRGFSR